MELLYFWLEKSENEYIRKEEFVFSKEFNISFDDEEECIKIYGNNEHFNVFKNDNINNVTAIVGKNGSGKTTLFKEIYNFNFNEADCRTIMIFKKEKEILIFCNFMIKNNYEIDGYNIIVLKEFSEIFGKPNKEWTRIYLTNAYFGIENAGTRSNKNKLQSASFHMNIYNILGKQYFRMNYDKNSKNMIFARTIDLPFIYENLILNKKNTSEDFRNILDMVYITNIIQKRLDETADLKKGLIDNIIDNRFTFKFKNLYQILPYEIKDIEKSINGFSINHDNKILKRTIEKFEECRNILINIDYDQMNIIDTIKKNLFIETYILENRGFNSDDYEKSEDLDYLINNIDISKDHHNDFMKKKKEIESFENVYNKYLDDESEENYNELLFFLKSCFNGEESFILKFINLEFSKKFSSGERALLNIFSWIGTLEEINKINPNYIDGMNKNVLLLIDELDLYCHPEWQRKILKTLIDELKNQFSDKKIQIILSTHSPIILSDFPNNNIIYMEEGCVKKDFKQRTFGSNIYDLFKEPFYLKKTIGAFAESKIEDTIKFIKKNDNRSKDERDSNFSKKLFENKILVSYIGEEFVRKSLNTKLNSIDNKLNNIAKKEEILRLSNEIDPMLKDKIKEVIEEDDYND